LGCAYADTIVVYGKRLEDVYIRSTSSFHIVLTPGDGKSIAFRHADVDENSIEFTANTAEREELLDAWTAQNLEKSKRKTSAANVSQPRGGGKASRRKAPVTDRPKRRSRRGKQVAKFINPRGNSLLTDRPEMYEGRPDYIEIDFNFTSIRVPKRYRGLGGAALGGRAPIDALVRHYAKEYAVDPLLVYAVIKVESDGKPRARSSKGASGLMQLMPGTAADMGVTNPFDPAQNIAGGTQYLAKLLELFENDLPKALAGYNAGPGNVKKYGGIPPFRETRDYVKNVQKYYRDYTRDGTPCVGRKGMSAR
jgi:soluble lytic murein transglycosylase-like protein